MALLTNRVILAAAWLAFVGGIVAAGASWAAEDDALAAKVSTFAPAEDLTNQADVYIKGLERAVANEEDYKDDETKVAKQANTLAVIALALGLHDQPNKYKQQAGAMMKAAQAVAASKDYASAKKAVADLRAVAEGKASANVALKWEKVASLPELMKQVPVVNQKLRLFVKPAKIKSKGKDTAGYSAVIAVIGHVSIVDTSEAKNPEQVKQWQKFAIQMRDDAGELNAAIHKADATAADQAMKKLTQSCEDCHVIFHPDVN